MASKIAVDISLLSNIGDVYTRNKGHRVSEVQEALRLTTEGRADLVLNWRAVCPLSASVGVTRCPQAMSGASSTLVQPDQVDWCSVRPVPCLCPAALGQILAGACW